MNTDLISATCDTAILMPPAPDALDRLLMSIDGPTALLVAAVLRERIDLYPTANATVLSQSLRTMVQALEMRRDQHRASPFAMDRVSNLAQMAESQAEIWDEYAKSYDLESEEDIATVAAARARRDVLSYLLSSLRAGTDKPFVAPWVDQLPVEDAEEIEIDNVCPDCSGCGQGMWEGTRCVTCRGTGLLAVNEEA